MNDGLVPENMKKAVVAPLLKKQGLDPIPNNYRPVSNLSFISKLIEGVVARQLTSFCAKKNNLHESMQSAYKQCHNTETALLRVKNDLVRAMDKQQVSLLVLLDLLAAFDTVDHDILLNVLSTRFDIKGTALNWFQSYLNSRTQAVSINRKMS